MEDGVGRSVMRRQKGMVVDASAREEKTRRAPPLGQHLAGLFGLVLPPSIYFRLFVACRARATGLERRPVGLFKHFEYESALLLTSQKPDSDA